jgi:hypothetical protein
LDAGAAFSNAAAAVAAFFFATQASLLCFCRFSYPSHGRVLAILSASAHLQRIASGEVVALVASAHFRNQSGPGSCTAKNTILESSKSENLRYLYWFFACLDREKKIPLSILEIF